MKYYYQIIICLWVVALTLAGCGGPAYTREQQTVEGLSITLEHPERTELLKEYDVTIILADASGNPVDGATVFLDMTMPAMPMGQNRPLADPLGGGRYRLKTTYTMDGDWVTHVYVTVEGKEHRATFNYTVVPQ